VSDTVKGAVVVIDDLAYPLMRLSPDEFAAVAKRKVTGIPAIWTEYGGAAYFYPKRYKPCKIQYRMRRNVCRLNLIEG